MATKKISLNELRTLVKQIIKEENSSENIIKKIEHASPGKFYFRRSFINNNPFRVFVTVDNYNGEGITAELLYGIPANKNRDSFKYSNGTDYDADIIDIDVNFKNNLITRAKQVNKETDSLIRDKIAQWTEKEIKMS